MYIRFEINYYEKVNISLKIVKDRLATINKIEEDKYNSILLQFQSQFSGEKHIINPM